MMDGVVGGRQRAGQAFEPDTGASQAFLVHELGMQLLDAGLHPGATGEQADDSRRPGRGERLAAREDGPQAVAKLEPEQHRLPAGVG
jgi:hypothetical protein